MLTRYESQFPEKVINAKNFTVCCYNHGVRLFVQGFFLLTDAGLHEAKYISVHTTVLQLDRILQLEAS